MKSRCYTLLKAGRIASKKKQNRRNTMKLLALGLAALMSFSAPAGFAHAFNGENADAARDFERPAVCQKADGFFGAFRFDGERAEELREKMENGEIPRFDGKSDLSKFKPGKDIEDIKEKLDGMTEEEKAEIKEKVQSSFGEKEFAGKPKIPGNVGRGRPGNFRPSFGTNEQ